MKHFLLILAFASLWFKVQAQQPKEISSKPPERTPDQEAEFRRNIEKLRDPKPITDLPPQKPPTPEEQALHKKISDVLRTVNEEIMRGYKDDDPDLLFTYSASLRREDAVYLPKPVEDDLNRRGNARELFLKLLREGQFPDNRASVMYWLYGHPGIPWGPALLEDAIALYRGDTRNNLQWNESERTGLARFIVAYGNETHLPLLAELKSMAKRDGAFMHAVKERLLHRLEQDKKNTPPAPVVPSGSISAPTAQKADTTVATRGGSVGESPRPVWLPWLVVVIVATAGVIWLALGKKQ